MTPLTITSQLATTKITSHSKSEMQSQMNDTLWMWAALSQLIFIVIFCTVQFDSTLRFNKTCQFPGREATGCISRVKPEKLTAALTYPI